MPCMRRPRRQLPAGPSALRLRVPPSPPSEWSPRRMTEDDVLFGYRLQLFDLAARTTVSDACRVFGVHRSTYYRWKHQVDRSRLEMLRPQGAAPAGYAQSAPADPRGTHR